MLTVSNVLLSFISLFLSLSRPPFSPPYFCPPLSLSSFLSALLSLSLSISLFISLSPSAYLSVPQISFTISKEGSSYHGNVTCRSSRGTPPVTFYLFLDDKEVGSDVATESLVAWFPVAMVPGRDMGAVRCTVESDAQRLTSRPLTLVVGTG